MARKQPVYFPWNPLVGLLTEHRLYPFDAGLNVLWNSRLMPTYQSVLEAVPAGRAMVYSPYAQNRFILYYLAGRGDPAEGERRQTAQERSRPR
jgi:hypothetical protein